MRLSIVCGFVHVRDVASAVALGAALHAACSSVNCKVSRLRGQDYSCTEHESSDMTMCCILCHLQTY
jgi:hypothetical protein